MTKAAELAKIGEVATNSQIGGRRNIVINGAMQVAQRATTVTGLGATADTGYQTVDRFRMTCGNTAGRFTQSQVADVHDGFAFALKLDCTTADTSIAAAESLILETRFEGQNLQQLKKGTSDAEKFTVSFYVKGNGNATYTCELRDQDNTRNISQEFAVTSDWNRIILTFNNETSNALDNDNASSMVLNIWLHAGANFTSGTHAVNTWHTTNANRLSDSQSSFFSSTDNTFFLTGVQMEVGSQATPFEHRSFGEEQELCKRYFQKINNLQCFATTNTSERLRINANCIPVMRAGGTAVIIAAMRFINEGAAYYSADTSEAQAGPKGAAAFQMDIDNFSTNSNGDGGGTTPTNSAAFLGEADAFIFTYDAEL